VTGEGTTTVRVTTTPSAILRDAFEHSRDHGSHETQWEATARTLDEFGYVIVNRDQAAEGDRDAARFEFKVALALGVTLEELSAEIEAAGLDDRRGAVREVLVARVARLTQGAAR
jgi:hypothetical protein